VTVKVAQNDKKEQSKVYKYIGLNFSQDQQNSQQKKIKETKVNVKLQSCSSGGD